MSTATRIDFVGLIWRNTADYMQDNVLPTVSMIQAYADTMSPGQGRIVVKVGRSRSGGGTIYELDAWGEAAKHLADRMPDAWWLRLTRLDYREQLGDWLQSDIHTFASELHRRGIPGYNTSPLNKRDAQKTDRRGVGGAGIMVGSWRSAKSMTIYKRVREAAVVEIRLNSRLAAPLGKAAYEWGIDNPHYGVAFEAQSLISCALNKFLDKTLGTTKVDEVVAEVVEYVNDVDAMVSEMGHRRSADYTGQMDFWSTVGDLGADVQDTFRLVNPPRPLDEDVDR